MNIKLLCISGLALLLSACESSTPKAQAALPQLSKNKSAIIERQLVNGTRVKLAMLKPKISWNCHPLATQNYSWYQLRAAGRLTNVNRGYGVLWANAIDYANQHHLKTNYIYYRIPYMTPLLPLGRAPTETPADNVKVIYYQCQKTG